MSLVGGAAMFARVVGRTGPCCRMLCARGLQSDGTRFANSPELRETVGLPADVGAALIGGVQYQSPHVLEMEWSQMKWGSPVVTATPVAGHKSVTDRVDITVPGSVFAKISCVKDFEGNIRLFRPSATLNRFQERCLQQGLPGFDRDDLLECIASLLRTDSDWIPDAYGYSMDVSLKTTAGDTTKDGQLVCVLHPRPPRNRWPYTARTGDKGGRDGGVALSTAPECVAGDASQLSHTLVLDNEAFKCAPNTGNAIFMVVDKHGTGSRELVTAPVDPSRSAVLRSTVLQLASKYGDLTVKEAHVSLAEVLDHIRERRANEVFATVSQSIHPVRAIVTADQEADVGHVVALASQLDGEINEIKYGGHKHSDEWTTVVSSAN